MRTGVAPRVVKAEGGGWWKLIWLIHEGIHEGKTWETLEDGNILKLEPFKIKHEKYGFGAYTDITAVYLCERI